MPRTACSVSRASNVRSCQARAHGQAQQQPSSGTGESGVKRGGMLVRLGLLLCVAAALAKRHRPAVVELASRGEEPRVPSDAIGDVALRDRLETVHRARLARLLRLRRQQQQQRPDSPEPRQRPVPVAHGGPNAPLEAPAGAGGGRRDYDDDNDDDSSGDDGDTLYADEEEEDQSGGMHGGVGRGGKQGDGRSGGRVGSSHRDPYTDVGDDNDDYSYDHNDNKGRGPKGLSGGELEGVNGRGGPGGSRDDQRLRRRMDCIADRVNHCIEWCRLKPTDTRLRQNRDNEPCRYWKGDSKNKWMQSGICHNGRCA